MWHNKHSTIVTSDDLDNSLSPQNHKNEIMFSVIDMTADGLQLNLYHIKIIDYMQHQKYQNGTIP